MSGGSLTRLRRSTQCIDVRGCAACLLPQLDLAQDPSGRSAHELRLLGEHLIQPDCFNESGYLGEQRSSLDSVGAAQVTD